MSKAVELAYVTAQNSQIRLKRDGTIEIMDAAVFWPDFGGTKSKLAKPGEVRSFNVALNEEMLQFFIDLEQERGLKIRIREVKMFTDEALEKDKNLQQVIVKYINIKVKFYENSPQPLIAKMFTTTKIGDKVKKGEVTLDENTIGELDRADIETWDIVVHAYKSRKLSNNGEYASLYLNKLAAVLDKESDWEGRYDEWLKDDEDDPTAKSAIEVVQQNLADGINPATGEKMR